MANPTDGEKRPKQRRGFAAMDPAKQREIAAKGGRASQLAGTGYQWTGATAKVAGRKGGMAPHKRRPGVSDGPRAEDLLPPKRRSPPRP